MTPILPARGRPELQPHPLWLVDGPDAGRGKFHQMTVGIPEVKAFAATRPFHAALDFDTGLAEPLLPSAKILRRNGEGEMHLAAAAMRRNHTSGQRHRFRSAAAMEEDQDVASGYVERAETLVAR